MASKNRRQRPPRGDFDSDKEIEIVRDDPWEKLSKAEKRRERDRRYERD